MGKFTARRVTTLAEFTDLIFIGITDYSLLSLQRPRAAQKIVPLVSVQVFMLMLCHDGYLIGSISPATMVGYVGTIGVGLVLFERKIVYSAFIPATIILAVCTYLSMNGVIPYAPLFNFTIIRHAQTNPFWLEACYFLLCRF